MIVKAYVFDFGFFLVDSAKSRWYNYGDRKSLEYHILHLKKYNEHIYFEIHQIDFSQIDKDTQELITNASNYLCDLADYHEIVLHGIEEQESLIKLLPEKVYKKYISMEEGSKISKEVQKSADFSEFSSILKSLFMKNENTNLNTDELFKYLDLFTENEAEQMRLLKNLADCITDCGKIYFS